MGWNLMWNPTQIDTTLALWEDLRPVPDHLSKPPSPQTIPLDLARSPISIPEAQGWTIDTNGDVILTAHVTSEAVYGDRPAHPSPAHPNVCYE